MPKFISLMNLTEKGVQDIKNAPARIKKAVEMLEQMGGKLIDFYMVMGEYDYIGIAEAPSDEVTMKFLMALGAAGNVRTTTLKAFTQEEILKLVE